MTKLKTYKRRPLKYNTTWYGVYNFGCLLHVVRRRKLAVDFAKEEYVMNGPDGSNFNPEHWRNMYEVHKVQIVPVR